MFQRLAHIILALLLFISSTGLVVNKHYCQNELKSIAFFHEAEGCHKEKQMSCPMHPDSDGDEEKKGCCDDETELVKSDENQLVQSLDLDLKTNPVLLLSVLFFALNLESPTIDRQSIDYLNYKPPLIVCDLTVSLQTFLC